MTLCSFLFFPTKLRSIFSCFFLLVTQAAPGAAESVETSAAVAKESAKETANAENDNARFGFLGQGGAVGFQQVFGGIFQGFFPNGFF